MRSYDISRLPPAVTTEYPHRQLLYFRITPSTHFFLFIYFLSSWKNIAWGSRFCYPVSYIILAFLIHLSDRNRESKNRNGITWVTGGMKDTRRVLWIKSTRGTPVESPSWAQSINLSVYSYAKYHLVYQISDVPNSFSIPIIIIGIIIIGIIIVRENRAI